MLVLLLTIGCSSWTSQEFSTPEPTRISLPMPITITPLPALKTAIPTKLPTPELSTLTPQPTLSAEDTKSFVLNLLQNNGGCQLSCLWGMIPGQVSTSAFNDFMAHFSNQKTNNIFVAIQDFDQIGGFDLIYWENTIDINIDFSYYKNGQDATPKLFTLDSFAMQDKNHSPNWMNSNASPIYGNAHFNQVLNHYTLPQILINLGRPSQVLLYTFREDSDRPNFIFIVVLLYPERGVYAKYTMPRETSSNTFIGCPSKANISIAVWSPQNPIPFDRVVEIMNSGGNMVSYISIDKATSMTLDEFYQNFKNPKYTDCIKTPINVWP